MGDRTVFAYKGGTMFEAFFRWSYRTVIETVLTDALSKSAVRWCRDEMIAAGELGKLPSEVDTTYSCNVRLHLHLQQPNRST